MQPMGPHIGPGQEVWDAFGMGENPSVRQQLLAMTVVRVGHLGPSQFSPKALAAELGITQATVNYHFNSREQLLAEAAVLGYANYVATVWAAVEAAPRKPEKRLRTWLETAIDVQVAVAGWGPVYNYPATAFEVTDILEQTYAAQMKDYSELNMARLITLVGDVRRGRVTDIDYELGAVPRLALLKDARVLTAVTSIGWSLLGYAVWKSGRHLPSKGTREVFSIEARARKAHLDRMIAIAKGDA